MAVLTRQTITTIHRTLKMKNAPPAPTGNSSKLHSGAKLHLSGKQILKICRLATNLDRLAKEEKVFVVASEERRAAAYLLTQEIPKLYPAARYCVKELVRLVGYTGDFVSNENLLALSEMCQVYLETVRAADEEARQKILRSQISPTGNYVMCSEK